MKQKKKRASCSGNSEAIGQSRNLSKASEELNSNASEKLNSNASEKLNSNASEEMKAYEMRMSEEADASLEALEVEQIDKACCPSSDESKSSTEHTFGSDSDAPKSLAEQSGTEGISRTSEVDCLEVRPVSDKAWFNGPIQGVSE